MASSNDTMTIIDVAEQLADIMLYRLNKAKGDKPSFAILLHDAIIDIYGSRENFYKKFFSKLSKDQLVLFFEILNNKMKLTNVDSKIIEEIRDSLKNVGLSGVSDVEASRNFAPSTTAGMSPYGNKKGR